LTHYDELEARSTMSRLVLAVDDGEHTDAAAGGARVAPGGPACRTPRLTAARSRSRSHAARSSCLSRSPRSRSLYATSASPAET
jgi:hypothetical protein